MLFAAECWFSHSYDPQTLEPYPAYDAMRQADAPVGLAWETGRRRFFAGEKLDTAVFISNDDDQFRDLYNLKLEVTFSGDNTRELTNIAALPYSKTIRVPVTVVFPPTDMPRQEMEMLLRLKRGPEVVSETTDPVEVFQMNDLPVMDAAPAKSFSLGPELNHLFSRSFVTSETSNAAVILLGSDASLDLLETTNAVRQRIENGATAIVFSPGQGMVKMFPKAIIDTKKVVGEYADFSPITGTFLAEGLRPMDLKWWGRTNDWKTFVASQAQRLRENGPARELIRYIPPHGYMALDKLPEQYWTVMWELRLGRGRLWICDLDLEECAGVDPAARLFAETMFRAAADPASTSSLPRILSHEELLKERN
jgi:hypothetical protein